jgi:hypothetical protein
VIPAVILLPTLVVSVKLLSASAKSWSVSASRTLVIGWAAAMLFGALALGLAQHSRANALAWQSAYSRDIVATR